MSKSRKRFRKLLIIDILAIFIVSFFANHSYADEIILPDIYSPSAILVDAKTGQILYEKNSHERMFPASTTKLMTAMLVLENCGLDDEVVITSEAVSAVPDTYMTADLQVGEMFTVDQLLQLLLIPSANDVANALACHVSGSIDQFAELMNNKAASLGANDTHFTNPSGVHDENHYSTAYDMCIIGQYANSFSRIKEIAMQKECEIPDLPDGTERKFTSTNTLMMEDRDSYYEYATGLKTGFTNAAKSCIVAKADKDDMELICVVLGGDKTDENLSGRDEDCKTLFEYGFNNFEFRNYCENGSIVDTSEIDNLPEILSGAKLAYKNDIKLYVHKSCDVTKTTEWKDNLKYPILKRQSVGTVKYVIDGKEYTSEIYTIDNILPVEVEKAVSYVYYILIGILVLIIVSVVLECIIHKKRKQKKSESSDK